MTKPEASGTAGVSPAPGTAGVSPAPPTPNRNLHPPKGWHSRLYIPHFDDGEGAQLITFRLAASFPRHLLAAWQDELMAMPRQDADRERLRRIEAHLDKGTGSALLRDAHISEIVEEALLYLDGVRYRLHAWVVMPNHVHVLMTPIDGHNVSSIIHSWKSYTTHKINRSLGRSGRFWQEDYFDRYIRDERHFSAALAYVEGNPVRAGLCSGSAEWRAGSAGRS